MREILGNVDSRFKELYSLDYLIFSYFPISNAN